MITSRQPPHVMPLRCWGRDALPTGLPSSPEHQRNVAIRGSPHTVCLHLLPKPTNKNYLHAWHILAWWPSNTKIRSELHTRAKKSLCRPNNCTVKKRVSAKHGLWTELGLDLALNPGRLKGPGFEARLDMNRARLILSARGRRRTARAVKQRAGTKI